MESLTQEQVDAMDAAAKSRMLMELHAAHKKEEGLVEAEIADVLLMGGSETADLEDLLRQRQRLQVEMDFIERYTGTDRAEHDMKFEKSVNRVVETLLTRVDERAREPKEPEAVKPPFVPMNFVRQHSDVRITDPQPAGRLNPNYNFTVENAESFAVNTPDGGLVLITPHPKKKGKLHISYYSPKDRPPA